MMRILLAISLIFSSSIASARAMDDFKVFQRRHPMKLVSIDRRFEQIKESSQELREITNDIKKEYTIFYRGEEDDGGIDEKYDAQNNNTQERLAAASAFVNKILVDYPAEEVNVFIRELLRLYLASPQARPAIKDVVEAFTAKEFGAASEFEKAKERSDLYQASTGAGVGGFAAGVLICVFRSSFCDEARRLLTRNSRIELRAAVRKMGLSAKERTVRTIRRLRNIFSRASSESPVVAESIGSIALKQSFARRFYNYVFKEQLVNLGIFVGLSAPSGYIWMKIQKAKREGKPIETYLNPSELERLYYTSLAVLELTCKARVYLSKNDISRRTLRGFTVRAFEEVQLLGQMAGGVRIMDALTPLNFVTPHLDSKDPNKDYFVASIPLQNEKIAIKRSCPRIRNMGQPIRVHLGELEDMIEQLIEKDSELFGN